MFRKTTVGYQNILLSKTQRLMQIIKVSLINIFFYVNLVIITFPCSCDSNNDNGLSDNQIAGLVTLENQTEHDGIIVYLSGANVGTITDIDGNFILSIPDTVDTSGVFTLYYYHALYDLCSLFVEIDGNNSIESSADLTSKRYLPDKELEQIFKVNMVVEKNQYIHGEHLSGSVQVINVFNRTILVGLKDYAEYPYTWVLYNLANRDNSLFLWGNNTWEPDWVILQVGDTVQTPFRLDICTQGDCSSTYRIIPGEYYCFTDINAREGHPYTFKMTVELRDYLKNNHYEIIRWDFAHDPEVVLSRLGFSKIIIN